MNCPNEQTLSAFHDGELPSAEMSQVRSHMASCDACREMLAMLQQASSLVKDADLSDVSPEMFARWASAGTVVQDRAIRRLIGSLTAIAASVLIVASIARQQASESSAPTIGEWEQIAFAGGGRRRR